MKNWCSILALVQCFAVDAQMPETDVWLFSVQKDKAGKLSIQKPVNITSRPGYDNQPAFSNDGRWIYYSSYVNGQSDVYAYDTRKKKTSQVTATAESEYSPRPVANGTLLSAVVVEKDSAQRLHFFSAVTGAAELRFETDSIGYYSFLTKDTLLFYKVTEPPSLWWSGTKDHTAQLLAKSVCRTFWPINRHSAVFGITDSSRTDYYIYDFALMKARLFASHAPGSEDTWWHKDLGLLIAHGDKILRYAAEKKDWAVLFDFGGTAIKRITRFVFDEDGRRLALVNNL